MASPTAKPYWVNTELYLRSLDWNLRTAQPMGIFTFLIPTGRLKRLLKNNNLVPEFRIIGDFPVDAHIISALWINMVGHKFDACLDRVCYGARLKRVRDDETLDKDAGKPFHITSVGSFTPYFQPYQKWRNDGMKSIRDELEKEREVVRELVVPILRAERVVAILGVDNKSGNYTDDDVELVTYMADIVCEITERKRNEEEQKRQGVRYQMLQSVSRDGIHILSLIHIS